ncbi:multiple sugar transport system ATP-binding protein [Monaibacterium marinum]|uniref:Multiple sugar transport system ATP-binding protein n=1 Tax=Pontivivens marinum TaxID=1690039 RepID=A0A2C9CX61_9RHOB|nr:sn-glycerol-3-phosphate ABC transporter ATP-binding protein UgpC [Monaibacterium marinum]SOH95019.1 multiple sugar transport system ATP-binding protein [Monaibacterium marinum]
MSSIELKSVEKWFGNAQVIKGVDLSIDEGEFIIFVGPSGCGKSTLLRMIAGLEETSRGQIMIAGRDATAEPPSKRGLAMVFQSYALYPHMSVRDNMGFSLKAAGVPKAELDRQVNDAARVLKLEPFLDRRPKDLSGGQRQRVAIGRSIVREPTAFLFDEPLSNLDASLRVEMRYEIAKLHQSLKSTMIYVTHDQVEAMTLADRIVVLDGGHIAQVGSPRELYERPANLFVAQFIGSPRMNVMPCTAEGAQFVLPGQGGGAYGRSRSATSLGIRPEHIDMTTAGDGHLDGVVDVLEYLGSDTFVIVECGDAGKVTVRINGDTDLRPGQACALQFRADHLHFFDDQGQAVLN